MHYPSDSATHAIDTEFFYGPSILVSPVTEADATSVTFYMPKDIFYDYATLKKIPESGANVTRTDVKFTDIPIHIKGGSIVPARMHSANTTTALRAVDFELLIAPDKDGKASGSLYLDDGESIEQQGTSEIDFSYEVGKLGWRGSFGYKTSVGVKRLTVMGEGEPAVYAVNGTLDVGWDFVLPSPP
jgi:alpha-glucosidase